MTANPSDPSAQNAQQQQYERILSQASFEGLKAILNRLSPEADVQRQVVLGANNFVELLARFGYQLTITKQIHVQDCYSRLGPQGGIKAVLPYHDMATQTSLPTLINFDFTVTATPKSAAFFDALLFELKKQLDSHPSGGVRP